MASRRTVEWSGGQQHELEAHRDHDPRPYVRRRARGTAGTPAGGPHWQEPDRPRQARSEA